MSLVVTIIVRTDVALLARMLSIMDVVAGFQQSRKVAPGPGADEPMCCMSGLMFFEVGGFGKSLVAASCSRANIVARRGHY